MFKNFLTTGLMVMGCVAGAAAVQASDTFGAPTKTVSYDDLNMDSDKGAQMVYGRIKSAAHDVCSNLEGRDPMVATAWKSCYDKAVSDAVSRVNNSKVTALYNKSSKSSSNMKFASLR